MEIGIGIPSGQTAWKIAQRAEELGFSFVKLWDSPLIGGDPFAAMGAVAVKTSKIRIGNGVYVPANRSPAVTASGFATLNGLAPGRIEITAGTGFTARRTFKQPPMTRKAFQRHMLQVDALLKGESTLFGDGDDAVELRLLHDDFNLFNIKDKIPITIAAAGPKLIKFTADNGFNWLNAGNVFGNLATSIEQITEAWTNAGRDLKDLRKSFMFAGCLMRPDETLDSPRVRAVAGSMAAVNFHHWIDAEQLLGQDINHLLPKEDYMQKAMDQYRDLYRTYEPGTEHREIHIGHCLFLRPDEEDIITGDIIRDTTMTAHADEMKERLELFRDAGAQELGVAITPGQEDCLEDWANFFELKPR